MSVRRAKASDLDAVLAIEGRWPTTAHWTRKQFEAELDDPNSIFLVCENGFLVARKYGDEVHLLDIAVAQKRRGTGKRLLAELSGSVVKLEVSARNPEAQAFYEAQGFRVVGRRPKFYNDGADAVLMDLAL
jgi:[ribosomal protein S18]-alanine N-acetyltransferase